MAKNAKFNREDLIEEVVTLQAQKMMPRRELLKYVIDTYGYSEPESYKILQAVNKKISEIWEQSTLPLLENAVANLEYQRATALANNDGALALKITQEMNKIQGLYIEKITMNGTVEYIAKFGE